jgi:protein phosphatase
MRRIFVVSASTSDKTYAMERIEPLLAQPIENHRSSVSLRSRSAERFVAREPLRRVHECVFGVLALESEPVDPRL